MTYWSALYGLQSDPAQSGLDTVTHNNNRLINQSKNTCPKDMPVGQPNRDSPLFEILRSPLLHVPSLCEIQTNKGTNKQTNRKSPKSTTNKKILKTRAPSLIGESSLALLFRKQSYLRKKHCLFAVGRREG